MEPIVQEDLVSVPVPRSLVTEVMALIVARTVDRRPAERTEARAVPPADEDGPASGAPAHLRDWSIADYQLLIGDKRPSVARILRIMDVLAQRPGQKLSTTALAEATSYSRGQLRGAFSGFSRVCATLRPEQKLGWPMEWVWGAAEQEGLDTETYYWLPEPRAARWLEARAG